mmetsp:Transcript_17959/g.33167  ORF Transcript_17959/g.33167 Transcript_17959/m.33167 type:complete len:932 (+) Transcript_17959:194-2989(+)
MDAMLNNLNIPGLKKGGNDSKYFSTTKKGEIHELKEDLNDQRPGRRKEAVKKVIAAMTVGKDVSTLFADVLNCMQTASVELKKLVYLYLINYAKSHPDIAIMAVNTFRRDANDANPLIRALAIRTMGCIRVDKITEYLCDPLRRALKDEEPYVRKTAATCVAKLHDISPSLAEEQGFVELLRDLVSDSNPTVVANAVAALNEIVTQGYPNVFRVNSKVLPKILAALTECAEWGQVYILEAIATYTPKNAREAESIVERITPRLQHSNSAVVMSSVQVIMKCIDLVDSPDTLKNLGRKLSPPLVTLLSAEPEIQYVTLRNINLIVQKRPEILNHEIRVFFCRYNDPIYVKMEKLELMVLLCNDRNAEQVITELKEYATEVDVDFVRKAVRAIGRIAIKLDFSAEKCITVLLDLIKSRVNYVVQESIIVIKDIFRRYPNRYESIIATLCENLDSLDEPEAKASMVWIIGEYASRIDNADELLESFFEGFQEEPEEVQQQLLTATVKLFLKRPDTSQQLMESVLAEATENSDNPDLRDRGYLYWRLLSTDPEAAKRIVLSQKPDIKDDSSHLDAALLDELVSNIGTLASIYHKPASSFVKITRTELDNLDSDDSDDEDSDSDSDSDGEASGAHQKKSGSNAVDNVEDLLGFGSPEPPAQTQAAPSTASGGEVDLLGGLGGDFDPLGGSSTPQPDVNAQSQAASLPLLLDSAEYRLQGQFAKVGNGIVLKMYLTNVSAPPLKDFKFQFNKNVYALAPVSVSIDLGSTLSPGMSKDFTLPVHTDTAKLNAAAPPNTIDVALKVVATSKVEYFKAPVAWTDLLSADGIVEKKEFIAEWKSLVESQQAGTLRGVFSTDIDTVSQRLAQHNIFFIATRSVSEDMKVAYFSCKVAGGPVALLELSFKQGVDACKICVRSRSTNILPVSKQGIDALMLSSS